MGTWASAQKVGCCQQTQVWWKFGAGRTQHDEQLTHLFSDADSLRILRSQLQCEIGVALIPCCTVTSHAFGVLPCSEHKNIAKEWANIVLTVFGQEQKDVDVITRHNQARNRIGFTDIKGYQARLEKGEYRSGSGPGNNNTKHFTAGRSY